MRRLWPLQSSCALACLCAWRDPLIDDWSANNNNKNNQEVAAYNNNNICWTSRVQLLCSKSYFFSHFYGPCMLSKLTVILVHIPILIYSEKPSMCKSRTSSLIKCLYGGPGVSGLLRVELRRGRGEQCAQVSGQVVQVQESSNCCSGV